MGGVGGEEDIVVDSLVEVCSSADFVLESGQPLGLDMAVLQSVERCGEYAFSSNKYLHDGHLIFMLGKST